MRRWSRARSVRVASGILILLETRTPLGSGISTGILGGEFHTESVLVEGERIGVVKRLAVRTGRLRRSPAVHSRPIDLVVFQEPSQLVLLETSS